MELPPQVTDRRDISCNDSRRCYNAAVFVDDPLAKLNVLVGDESCKRGLRKANFVMNITLRGGRQGLDQ